MWPRRCGVTIGVSAVGRGVQERIAPGNRRGRRKAGEISLDQAGFTSCESQTLPVYFVYRELTDGIRVTLVRHHRRNPSFEMERE
jgi:hypothetical protein